MVRASTLFLIAFLIGAWGGAGAAGAQPPQVEPSPVAAPGDDEVRLAVDRILEQPEFVEFVESDTRSFREAVERLLRYLYDLFRSDEQMEFPPMATPLINLPLPPAWAMMSVLLLALSWIGFRLLSGMRRRPVVRGPGEEAAVADLPDPREQAPSVYLERAARLAHQGDFREALRALYLATLVALDRRQVISFEPTFTNQMYVRRMPDGETRRLFSEFTRLFDRKWYGREPTGEDEYRRCGRLAARICSRKESG